METIWEIEYTCVSSQKLTFKWRKSKIQFTKIINTNSFTAASNWVLLSFGCLFNSNLFIISLWKWNESQNNQSPTFIVWWILNFMTQEFKMPVQFNVVNIIYYADLTLIHSYQRFWRRRIQETVTLKIVREIILGSDIYLYNSKVEVEIGTWYLIS